MPVNGLALAYVVSGGVLLYAGATSPTGSVPQTLHTILKGSLPAVAASSTESSIATQGSGQNVGESAIVNDANQYAGQAYLFGGVPGTSGYHPTDCSGFVNMVLGRDLKLAIPGYAPGQYTGSTHGPVSASYLTWSGASNVPGGLSNAMTGDLLCWFTHIGFYAGNNRMLSAYDHAKGVTYTSATAGPTGEPLTVRRLI